MTRLRTLTLGLVDATWLTVTCVSAIPTIVRAARAHTVEPHRGTCASCVVAGWAREGAVR